MAITEIWKNGIPNLRLAFKCTRLIFDFVLEQISLVSMVVGRVKALRIW